MKIIASFLYALSALLISQTITAGSGLFYNILATGTPANLSITLCLNGKGALSCQNYMASALNLSISTTIPNHVYSYAGIRVNTPGYILKDCIPTSNGYCLFSVSDTTPASISINNASAFIVSGTVSGLVGTVILQNNSSDAQSISANGNFTFSSPIATGSPYIVAVQTQPADQTCMVTNGSGTMGDANVTDITVTCSQGNTTLSVPATGVIPVGAGNLQLTVTNTGSTFYADNVHAVLNNWPLVTQDDSNCTAIPPHNGTCTLVFTSIAPYLASNIIITGDNTPSATVPMAFSISDYLVFSVDSASSASVIDSSNLPSSPTQWGYPYAITGATSFTAGMTNTAMIATTANIGVSAAVNCYNSTAGGAQATTWYLPAIDQMNTIDTNLFQFGFSSLTGGDYWSSTESGTNAYYHSFEGDVSTVAGKADVQLNVRCARSIPY
ncbi:MAG: hypothetical protein ACHP65_09135 [Legionellales bacterium]